MLVVVPEGRAQHWGAGLGGVLCGHRAGAVGSAASLHRIGKSTGHGHGVLRQGHGRVQQHAVVAPFHDLARVGGQAQACIHQQWHAQPLTQGLQRVGVHRAATGANGRSPGHDRLAADIEKNLEREVKFRLLARNKAAVMDALVAKAELDLPNASVQAEIARLLEGARAELKQRGIKDADKAEIPEDVFRPQAERRVRLGLVVAELVRANELFAKPEQLKAHIDELAASYEKPEDVVRWYFGDRQRLAEVEAVVIENNVTDFVLGQAKVIDKAVSFDELMAQG